MAANEVLGMDLILRLDQFRAEMAKIPDIGGKEAKELSAQLSKEIKSAEKAAKDAAKASKDAAKANKELGGATEVAEKATRAAGEAFGEAGSSAAKLAGGLDLLVPGLGEVARGIADMADIGEVASLGTGKLGISLGGTAVTLGILALAISPVIALWADYKQAEEEARAAEERRKSILEGHVSLLGKVRDAQEAALVELGQLTDAERQEKQAGRDWADAVDQQNGALEDQSVALRLSLKEIDEHTARTQLAHLTDEEYDALISKTPKGLQARSDALKDVTAAIAENEAAADLGLQADKRRIRAHEANTEAAKVEADAEKAAAEAKREGAEAARKAAEAARKAAEAAREQAAAMDAVVAVSQRTLGQRDAEIDATAALVAQVEKLGETEYDRIARTHRETDALLQEQIRANQDLGLSTEELEASRQKLRKKTHDLYTKLSDEEIKKERQKQQAIEDATYSTAASVADAVQQVAEAVQATAEEGTAQQKKLALVAFRVGQAAAVTSTIITTASAAMKAYSAALELGAPGLVLAPIAAGAAAATGAAQVATIASQAAPSFHTGLAPDETPAVLTRGEGVLTPRGVAAVGGSEGVRKMNRGETGPGNPIVVVQQYQHRVLDAAVADNLRQPTSPLRRAIRAGRRVGHRTRT